MSDNNFLDKYSEKIKALNPNDDTAGADWDFVEKRLNDKDNRRRRIFLLIFLVALLLVAIIGKYIIKLGDKPIEKVAIPTASIQKNEIQQHIQLSNEVFNPSLSNNEVDHLNENEANIIVASDIKATNKATTKNFENSNDYIDQFKSSSASNLSSINDEMALSRERVVAPVAGNQHSGFEQAKPEKRRAEDIIISDEKTSESTYAQQSNITHQLFVIQPRTISSIQNKMPHWIFLPVIKPKSDDAMKYFVKLDVGPIMAKQIGSTELMPDMLNFATYNLSREVGIQTGLSLQLVPNERWKFSVGLNRSQLVSQTSHTAHLRLMDGICLNPYGTEPKEYAFTYNVTNGRTSSTINLRLAEENPGNPLDSSEVFMINMGMHKTTINWAIPMTVERRLFAKGDWSILAKGGLSLGFLSFTKEHIVHFSEACADLCFEHGFMPSLSYKNSNQVSLGFMVGTSLEWKLSPRLNVVFSPELLTKVNLFNNNQYKSIQWGIQLGGAYKIN
jgi:hypothetical protein